MPKNTTIHIWNEHDWELDEAMLHTAMQCAARHAANADEINIYPQERVPADAPIWKNPGWLEWIVRIKYFSGGELTIGVIQRTLGAPFEFHT